MFSSYTPHAQHLQVHTVTCCSSLFVQPPRFSRCPGSSRSHSVHMASSRFHSVVSRLQLGVQGLWAWGCYASQICPRLFFLGTAGTWTDSHSPDGCKCLPLAWQPGCSHGTFCPSSVVHPACMHAAPCGLFVTWLFIFSLSRSSGHEAHCKGLLSSCWPAASSASAITVCPSGSHILIRDDLQLDSWMDLTQERLQEQRPWMTMTLSGPEKAMTNQPNSREPHDCTSGPWESDENPTKRREPQQVYSWNHISIDTHATRQKCLHASAFGCNLKACLHVVHNPVCFPG
jgi:hypothetical protein